MAELRTILRPTNPGETPAERIVSRCEVGASDIAILADIGVHDHEIGHRQPLALSVTLQIEPPQGDRLRDTFDYAHIVTLAGELGRQRIGLIETFALRLAHACLEHGQVILADVAIRKPQALTGAAAHTRIVLRRNPVQQ